MSFEAWGTPPDPEPRYCPVCDQESHSNDCELGKMQARAFLAEQQRDELLAALKEAIDAVRVFHGPVDWETYRDHSPEMKRWQAAIASVKGGAA